MLKREIVWLPLPFAPDYQVSEFGQIKEISTGRLINPTAEGEVELHIPLAQLVAHVWHTFLTKKPVPQDINSELLYADGNPANLYFDNLVFDEITKNELVEMDKLNH